jgi:hypothetical protein
MGFSNLTGIMANFSQLNDLVFTNGKGKILTVKKIINPQINCLEKKMRQMFDSSGCEIVGLKTEFKDMICDVVNNYCPYCDCRAPRGNVPRGFMNNDEKFSENINSFFHEEMIEEDEDLLNTELLIMDTDNESNYTQLINYPKFISKNLSNDELLKDSNLKIISIDKISKGKWLFNGNISIEIPKQTSMTNLKLYVYLDENIVSSGEIDLGSQQKSDSVVIKSHPFNLMFSNDTEGKELKIGLIPFDNQTDIKLLYTTNFFANQMQ